MGKNLTKKGFFAGLLLVAAFLMLPQGQAHAQVPQCEPTEIANFVPYIYDGELHSFDYFHNGVSGTPLKTQVGNIDLLPMFTSVWSNGVPPTKIHVDVPGWYGLEGTVPVHVEILSESGCVSTQTFVLTLPSKPAVSYTPVAGNESTGSKNIEKTDNGAVPAAPVVSDVSRETPSTTDMTPVEPAITSSVQCTNESATLNWTIRTEMFDQFVVERSVSEESFTQLGTTGASDRSFIDTSVQTGKQHTYRIVGIQDGDQIAVSPVATCVAAGESIATTDTDTLTCGWGSEWWTVFLIALVIISLVIINALEMLLAGNGWRFTVALFVPFALLLGLWFAFDTCRQNQWFPILVTLITLGTLFAPTFLRDETPRGVGTQ